MPIQNYGTSLTGKSKFCRLRCLGGGSQYVDIIEDRRKGPEKINQGRLFATE